MAYAEVGTQESSYVKLPTLREYAKDKDSIAEVHTVTRIFKPSKYANYTLECDGKFRCFVVEDSELFKWFVDNLEQEVENSTFLAVRVTLEGAKKGSFSLAINTDENTDWEETRWGWSGKVKDRPKSSKASTRTRKKQPSP